MSLCYLLYAFNKDLLAEHILRIASARATCHMEYKSYSVKITFVTVKNVYTQRSAGRRVSHSPSTLWILELVKCLPCIHTSSSVPFVGVALFLTLPQISSSV